MLRSSPFASSLSVHEGKQVISLDDELLAMMKLETPQMWMEQKQTKPPNKKAKIPTEPYKTDARLQPQKVSETLYEEWSAYKLNENILSSLEARGFNSPTQIQKLVLMESSKCQDGTLPDVIASAPTGSGKTLAFLLPLIHAILAYSQNVATKETSLNNNIHPPVSNVEASDEIVMTDSPMDVIPPILALILVPTRELAFQINHSALDLVRELGIRVALLTGGLSIQKQHRVLSKKVDILISTPGRLWSIIRGEEHTFLGLKERISTLSFLIIDEIDRMAEGCGHFKELWSILEILNPLSTMVFSATLDNIKVSNLQHKIPFHSRPPLFLSTVDTKEKKGPLSGLASNVSTFKLRCCINDRDACLIVLLERPPFVPTIVFVNSVAMIRRLCPLLRLLGINALPLHSQMPQRQRLKNIDRIKSTTNIEKNSILVATDVVGRGIDIPHVSRIIHFQIPLTFDQFIHRSGRTGRADTSGVSYLLISPEDYQRSMPLLKAAKNLIKEDSTLENHLWDPNTLFKIKERLEIAKAIDLLEHGTRKARFDEISASFLDDDDAPPTKHKQERRKRASGCTLEDEDAITERRITSSKLSKMKKLLLKLNLRKR